MLTFGSKPRRPTIGLVATDPPSGMGRTTVWLTPPSLLQALGPFDLDPCAAPEPRPWPTAARHITPPEDGLACDWNGLVWLNPPYSRSIGDWTDRLADHGEGIALVFVRSDADWWQRAALRATRIILLARRVKFCDRTGHASPGTAATASCLMAFGVEASGRIRAAQRRGEIAGLLAEVSL